MNRLILVLALASGVVAVASCTADKRRLAPEGTAAVGLRATHVRSEYLVDPIGLEERTPRFSWELVDARRGAAQTAYRVIVASNPATLEHPDLWDSGKVDSADTNQIFYRGRELKSGDRGFWRVQVWDQFGHVGPWSEVGSFELGLLAASDWKAKWIAPSTNDAAHQLTVTKATYESVDGKATRDVTDLVRAMVKDDSLKFKVTNGALGGELLYGVVKQLRLSFEMGGKPSEVVVKEDDRVEIPRVSNQPVPQLVTTFHLGKEVARARLYITALGLYSASINDQPLPNAPVLAPEFTDYKKRVTYQTYDVTPLLKQGRNDLSSFLAAGWYSGHIGNGGYKHYGTEPALMAQLEVTFVDETKTVVVSDGNWTSRRSGYLFDNGYSHPLVKDERWTSPLSPYTSTDFMLGESYDARFEVSGIDAKASNGYDNPAVKVVTPPVTPVLTGSKNEPVRQIMTLPAKSVSEPTPGHFVYDMGQNFVGVARLKLPPMPAGTKVVLRHAEMLNADGTMYVTNLRGAPSVDSYTCSGEPNETIVSKGWQPRFTFHGFRYLELTGLPAGIRPTVDNVTGVVLASDIPPAGSFICSDPRINQLQSNIVWGQRGNFLSVPTDCPQRDERLGWMGDAQVFISTAVYNADVAAFFTKWLQDVDDDQKPDGRFTDVAPDTMGVSGVPGWGDAGVICPWTIYRTYGDKRVLERNLAGMVKWVEWCKAHSNGLIREKDRGNDYGDWLSINADTRKDLIGTAFFAHSTDLTAKAARAVGRVDLAEKYDALFKEICAAFVAKYVHADGTIEGNTQASYLLPLQFGMLDDAQAAAATNHLLADIAAKDNHLSTGFLGVGYLLPVLSNTGHVDTAYKLLLQDSFPSWLFSVKHGATTIWERWDGWTPEKGFQDPGMNSFNHYSLGSCGQWLYGHLAGIRQADDSVAFRKIIIAPEITGQLTSASATYHSINGEITSAWKLDKGVLTLTVTIPPNTTASVTIPTTDSAAVMEAGKPVATSEGIANVQPSEGKNSVRLTVTAGSYKFTAPFLR